LESFLGKLVGTFLVLRPYVLAFFLVYLVGCTLHLGLLRALLFVPLGYAIAWLSEYSSIHTGIPYGKYFYIPETVNAELWVGGVPLMDSLSYVFLAWASYSMALFAVSPVLVRKCIPYPLETRRMRAAPGTRLLGALFMVYLDIVIDPVALRGDRWFLGKIYGYPEGGAYFGVPISNFVGWFVVGYVLIYALQKMDAALSSRGVNDLSGSRFPWRYIPGPALYYGVLAFNLAVTFAIGEDAMGWAGVFIVVLPTAILLRCKTGPGQGGDALRRHREDFPGAVLPGP
jgi:uncharacterized membrane protein